MDEQRVVRVFISSSFKDFEDERRILASDVFPKLREKYARRDVSVVGVDLRWGLSEEKIHELGLIDACLDQVIECEPYFIGLLGRRYGTTVSLEELRASRVARVYNLDQVTGHPLSITEIEFRIGAMGNSGEYALLFSSNSVAEPDEGMKRLKEELVRRGQELSGYDSLEQFSVLAFDKLDQLIDNRFPDMSSGLSPEQLAQKAVLSTHLASYVPGNQTVSRLVNRVKAGTNAYLCGAKGVGKSAAMAYTINELGKQGCDVYAYFCNVGYCTNEEGLIRRIAEFLEQTYDIEMDINHHTPFRAMVDDVSAAVARLHLVKRLYIVIDAIEQLLSRRNLWRVLVSMFSGSAFITCVVSGTEMLAAPEETLVLRGLERRQAETLAANQILESGRDVNETLISSIMGDHAVINPILLKGKLNELSVSGNRRKLDDLARSLSSISSIETMVKYIVDRIIDDALVLGLSRDFVFMMLAVLLNTRFGASEDEVLSIASSPTILWNDLKYALQPYIVSMNGRYRLSHHLVGYAIGSILEPFDSLVRAVIQNAVEEYSKGVQSNARSIELAGWASMLDDNKRFAAILMNPPMLATLIELDEDGLRGYFSSFQQDEGFLLHHLLGVAFAWLSDHDRLVAFAQCLSRSGCLKSCTAFVEQLSDLGADSPELLTIRARASYRSGSDYGETLRLFAEARDRMVRQGMNESVDMALLLLQTAIAQKSAGLVSRAIDSAIQACRIMRSRDVQSSEVAWAEVYLAYITLSVGDMRYARLHDDALTMQRGLSGQWSYAYCRLLCYSWQRHAYTGDLEVASRVTEQSMKGLLDTSGESPDYAWALTNRATVLAMIGRWEEARECSRHSQEINDLVSAGRHVYSLTGECNEILLDCLESLEQHAPESVSLETVRRLGEQLEKVSQAHGNCHPYYINVEANRALALSWHDPKTAASLLLSISRKLSAVLRRDNPDSLFLDTCSWRLGGGPSKRELLARHARFGSVDCVVGNMLEGRSVPRLRLAFNNGAALYLVPWGT